MPGWLYRNLFETQKLADYLITYKSAVEQNYGRKYKTCNEKTIYVGDTNSDLKVGRFPIVYANYGFGQANEYDLLFESFRDLLYLLFVKKLLYLFFI